MKKQHCWPEGHWNWPGIDICHKQGVRCGELIWVGGQVDLTPEGVVCNPGNLGTQTNNVMVNFERVLDGLDCDFQDLVTLLCFYVNDGSMPEAEFLKLVGACLPEGSRPAVNAVPVPYLAYDGLLVEIEGYAMRREDGGRTEKSYAPDTSFSPLQAPFCQAVRSGKMIFVSAQYPIRRRGQCPAQRRHRGANQPDHAPGRGGAGAFWRILRRCGQEQPLVCGQRGNCGLRTRRACPVRSSSTSLGLRQPGCRFPGTPMTTSKSRSPW